MTPTRIAWNPKHIARISDPADLAELLFPANRNQQHAFLVLWFALQQTPDGLVPNFLDVARRHAVSRRTLERVRAKLRRLGLIERVSRFHARFGGREGWTRSSRFERSLRQLADQLATWRATGPMPAQKAAVLIDFAAARKAAAPVEQTK